MPLAGARTSGDDSGEDDAPFVVTYCPECAHREFD